MAQVALWGEGLQPLGADGSPIAVGTSTAEVFLNSYPCQVGSMPQACSRFLGQLWEPKRERERDIYIYIYVYIESEHGQRGSCSTLLSPSSYPLRNYMYKFFLSYKETIKQTNFNVRLNGLQHQGALPLNFENCLSGWHTTGRY